MTKDFILILPFAFLAYILITDKNLLYKIIRTKKLTISLGICAAFNVGWLYIKYTIFNPALFSMVTSKGYSIYSLENWIFYLKFLPSVIGTVILSLLILALIAAAFGRSKYTTSFIEKRKGTNDLIYVVIIISIYLSLNPGVHS